MSYIPSSNDLYAILPMIILSLGAITLLGIQFWLPDDQEHTPLLVVTFLVFLGALFSIYVGATSTPGYGKYFKGQFTISLLTSWLNAIYVMSGLCTLLIAPKALEQTQTLFAEFYPLLLFAVTGMTFLTSGNDFIVIFVGLEILSLSLYILIGMARNSIFSLESAMKYFLLGAFSSGFMLMGIAFLFGGSGSTNMELALHGLNNSGYLSNYSKIGFGFFLIGVFFKIALVPFHAWTPDVYEGAQTPITGFMASAGKASAMGLLIVLFSKIAPGNTSEPWAYLVGVLSLVSMTWGNLAALRQTNLKRMLAYSSIAHAGYICAGISVGAGLEALYYLIIYVFMNLSVFGIVSYLEEGKRKVDIASISNLSASHPYLAIALSILFLSFAGLPPLGGFWAKLFLLQRLAESSNPFSIILLFGAVANSAIAFAYYMRIPVMAYMRTEVGSFASWDSKVEWGLALVVVGTLLLLSLGWLVFQPGALL